MCCGCTACFNVCPTKAITMTSNERGFYVPSVNVLKCISCGLCKKVCQIENIPQRNKPSDKYGIVNHNNDLRMKSSSGGLFSAILMKMFEQYPNRFHCFGVKFDDDLTAIHSCADSLSECADFRGSKYVQSDLNNVFTHIGQLLRQGDTVMFTGTGCQCAGLKNYIVTKHIDDSNLFVVDIVCHGAPSNGLWKDYIKAIEDTTGQKILSYKFRNKEDGWRGLHPLAILANGDMVERNKLFLSYGRFFGRLSLNVPCYSCKYANTKRIGDLTMGDYWGIEKSDCSFDDGKGVSLCLVNTQKGKLIFDGIRESIESYEIKDTSYLQPQLCAPTSRNILSKDFWKDYKNKGYMYVVKKYTGHSRGYSAVMKIFTKIKTICFIRWAPPKI
ncbi:coenzyme F420-reducing hydrogenase beta subunit [Sedimentibacter saalensis]|uniref:Coenzyme F420-reducing hydrogenase beta subunit n=2 Tax=Sedimentibacter saalensis TaxID=130788 RepID=A0A562J894_9FIRM|nr:coenzyme F420-reducing hydrogenase beta subunit [Sedimentibacter saalensis]